MSDKENSQSGEPSTSRRRRRRRRRQPADRPRAEATEVAQAPSDSGSAEDRQRKRRRRRRPARKAEASELRDAPASSAPEGRAQEVMVSGVLEILKNGSGMLRDPQKNMADQKDDVFIPKATLKKFFIKAGSVVEGKASGGQMRFVESI
ncbi:MAG: hypothetical protein MK213_10525, partial [Planctomycetes bacterium]|nr:hypothetical protein [Planctomycetota bacterium]